MKISVFGNPDLAFDNLPLKLLPRLREFFPSVDFVVEDPNELDLPAEDAQEWFIIDTVAGLPCVPIGRDLQGLPRGEALRGLPGVREVPMERLIAAPRVTAHDFDLGAYLALIHKLRPNLRVRIFGVPMHGDEQRVLTELQTLLASIIE